jgi:FkbM family methyltransferase
MVIGYIWNHPSNAGHRVRALLRLLRYQLRARVLRRRTIARIGDRSRLWVDLHRTAAAMALYANPPDLAEMRVWRRVLAPGSLFVDVGANVGTYTLWAAEQGADVISLEPAADTFALLEENVALNAYTVRTIQAAAGALTGSAGFTAGQDAGNHLDPDGPVQTPVVTIDSVIGDRVVAGMKVDTEGFELEVLRGCARALAEQRIRLIQLEWNAMSQFVAGTDRRPVADLLGAYGYDLYRPDAAGRLWPIADVGFGGDVFACAVLPGKVTGGSPPR